MADLVTMPKLGFDMQEGTLVRWVKKVGDAVSEGDVLAEIETDKATVEVEAYAHGTLRHTFVNENTVVSIGAPIAIIGSADEDISALAGGSASPAPASAPTSTPAPTASAASAPATAPTNESAPATPAPTPTSAAPATPAPAPAEGYPENVKASPLARKMAQEKGVPLGQVHGSGPNGRITKKDIEGFTPAEAPAMPAAGQTFAPATVAASIPSKPMAVEYEEIPLSRMRNIVGQRTQQSFQMVPHFFLTSEMDVAALLKIREQANTQVKPEEKITVNDLIVKAVALTLRDFPNLNTHFHGDKLIRYKRINIGIAVAVENGLINVVCHDADKRTLTDIASKNKEMIAHVREGKVKSEYVEGATFTVSNLGAYDVEHFLAIINPPEAAILAVGSAREVPVVVNGKVVVGTHMKATISIDHRVSDGAEGAQFMQRLKALIENPMRLLV